VQNDIPIKVRSGGVARHQVILRRRRAVLMAARSQVLNWGGEHKGNGNKLVMTSREIASAFFALWNEAWV
jgi:hypothetical protein